MSPASRRLALALVLALAAAPARASSKASYMHYIQGLLLQEKGLYTEALKEYQTVVGLDPQSPYVLEQAAELALDIGQAAQAMTFAKQLVDLEPKNPKAHFVLGNVQWAQGDTGAAEESFKRALKLDPANEEALFALGNLLSSSDPEKARGYYKRYIEANGEGSAEVYYQLSLIDQRAGQAAEAIAELKKAIELEPDYVQARFALAQLYEVQRDTDAALAAYLELLPRDPHNTALLNHVGELQFLKGQPDAAESFFDQAKAVEPSNPQTCFWKGFLAEQKGDWAKAAEELKASAALNDDPAVAMRLSYYLTQSGRLADAVDVLAKARDKWPKDAEIPYFLGLGYDDLGQNAKAVEAMSAAVALKPDSREARFQLAALQEKAGNIPEMEKNFRVLLVDHPDDAAALNYYGYSLADRGLRLDEAKVMIQKAVSLDPDNGAYVDSLGWVDFKLGQREKALAELRRAASLVADDESIWEHLGDAYSVTGDTQSAWSAYRLSQFIKPGGASVAKKLSASESLLSARETGALWLKFLERTHARFKNANSLVEVEGTVLSHKFSFFGLLQYKQGEDFKLQVLGPMFLPLWKMSVHEGAADLGGLQLPGIPQPELEAAAGRTLRLLADYFDGRLYEAREARYHKGWSQSYVETPDRTLFLLDKEDRLKSWRPRDDRDIKIELASPRRLRARLLPGAFDVEGPGFTLRLKLDRTSAEFIPPPAP